MSSVFIASIAVTEHPRIHDSHPLFSIFVTHLNLSVEAVTATGSRCPAPSALGLSVEGATSSHCTA